MSDIRNIDKAEATERFYHCSCPHGQYRSAIVFAWACVILAFVFQIACGIVSAVFSSAVLYTCIHTVFCVVVYAFLLLAVIRITMGKKKVSKAVYEKETKRIATMTLLAVIIAICGIVYEILSAVFVEGGSDILAVILCIVLHLFSAFAVFAARLSVMGLPFRLDSDR
ncbi:MAG: hypothetical protein E7660_03155 [Ruminococcaceae bacterium]|nr:hypothetical protein [Oscillospiraceae bacterium]